MEVKIYPVNSEYGGDFMKFCVREARVNIPKWYKDSKSFIGDPKTQFEKDRSMTMKKCTPILDYLSTGLTLHLPFTIYANGKFPNREIISGIDKPDCKIGSHHPGQMQEFPLSDDYDPYPLKIDFPYTIETPPGYSALFIGSTPYKDWPLIFPHAIVQVDKYKNVVNFPFLVKKDFTGKIDAGVEFMKIFFIKREELDISYMSYEDGKSQIEIYANMVSAFGAGFYKKLRLDNIF